MGDWTDFDNMDPVAGPLDLSLWFVRKDTSPPPQASSLSGSAGAPTRVVVLGNLGQSERDSLNRILSHDFSAFFDNAWQKTSDDVKAQMREKILEKQPDASNFSYSITDHGKLHGAVQELSPDMRQRLPQGAYGRQLTLIYKLTGIATYFHAKGLDLVLKVFIKLTYNIAFPEQTSVGVQMIAKQDVNPWLEGTGLWSSLALSFGRLLGLVDDPSPSSGGAIDVGGGLLHSLNAGFGLAAQFGFTTTNLSPISIADPNYHGPPSPPANPTGGQTVSSKPTVTPSGLALIVHIDLRHPEDQGPTFLDPPRPTLNPFFQLDREHAYPGDSVGIFGSNWPYTPWDRFAFYFPKSTTGSWKQTDVRFGVIPPGQRTVAQAQLATIAHLYPTVDTDSFDVPNLPPNTHVSCQVREYDLPDYICTTWSSWKDGWTSPEFAVKVWFYIKLANGWLWPLDTTVIDVDAAGSIDGRIDLPRTLVPGVYDVVARMAARESVTYTTKITIDDEHAPPCVQLVNLFNQPNGNETTPANLWGATQYLRGYHFKPSTLVLLSLDAVGGEGFQQLNFDMTGTVPHPGTLADARGDFFTNFEWPKDKVGPHTLVVVEDIPGGRSLSLPVVGT